MAPTALLCSLSCGMRILCGVSTLSQTAHGLILTWAVRDGFKQ